MTSPTPLLLTKRLNAFLNANQTPQLPTLLLTTSQGKLLAHASSQPVAVLRTHATVAASLLAIHTSSSVAVPSSFPGSGSPPDDLAVSPGHHSETDDAAAHSHDEDNDDSISRPAKKQPQCVKPVTITVQLSHGTVIIRRLKCGLLFVCVGPSTHDPHTDAQRRLEVTDVATSTSDGESLASAQTSTSLDSSADASVVTMRRYANELARWLDDKLGSLTVPEEAVGI